MKKFLIALLVGLLVVGGAAVYLKKAGPGPGTEIPAEISLESIPATESAATLPAEDIAPTAGEQGPADTAKADNSNTESESAGTDAAEPVEPAAPVTGESLLSAPAVLQIDMEQVKADRSIGSATAPVTVFEYASMTCPHCAHFHTAIFADVKKNLIDTGQLRLIYRDYPLDNIALRAAMMARCAPPEKYFDLVEVIFKNQDRWTKSADPVRALKQLGTLAGMQEEYIDACMNNAELESHILRMQQDGRRSFSIMSTPTFVFNNGAEKLGGVHDYATFLQSANKALRGSNR